MPLSARHATQDDIPAIESLIALSMATLLSDVLSPAQLAQSHASMGLDTQLIADGTYFLIFDAEVLVGCGGWSRRRTLFGGDDAALRDNTLADPKTEAAKIRAMYTHPGHARRGIGSMLLALGEAAAKAEGFHRIELGATASGLKLYERRGYALIEDISETLEDGTVIPNYLMRKAL